MKWGISYEDIHRMPIYEYETYVKFLNEYYEEERKSAEHAKNKLSGNTYGTISELPVK